MPRRLRFRSEREPGFRGVLRLPTSVLLAVALLATIGAVLGVWWLVSEQFTISDEAISPAAALTASFAVSTAVGAVFALVLSVRRQALAEHEARRAVVSAFTERFREAASQMGGHSAVERIAGVYAMAALADEYPSRRQQCVDVLCGYLRLPFDPDNNLLEADTVDTTHEFHNGRRVTQHRASTMRPHDQQVRETIVTVIRAHTVTGADPSWSGLDFDFRYARLHNANFAGARFAGYTDFDGVQFTGDHTIFAAVQFPGKYVSFDDVQFTGDHTGFEAAQFSGDHTSFMGAHFTGVTTSFVGSQFTGEDTSFFGSQFIGKFTHFDRAQFTGKKIHFEQAQFTGVDTSFVGVQFTGRFTTFYGVRFRGKETSFLDAHFTGEDTSFEGAHFTGEDTSFIGAQFKRVAVRFDGVELGERSMITGLKEPILLEGATVTRDGEPFRGWPPPSAARPEPDDAAEAT